MKAKEIKIGGLYAAKVSGKLVTVRVDSIRTSYTRVLDGPSRPERSVYDVTNLSTGRKTTFRSAQKFRSAVKGAVAGAIQAQARANEAAQENVESSDRTGEGCRSTSLQEAANPS